MLLLLVHFSISILIVLIFLFRQEIWSRALIQSQLRKIYAWLSSRCHFPLRTLRPLATPYRKLASSLNLIGCYPPVTHLLSFFKFLKIYFGKPVLINKSTIHHANYQPTPPHKVQPGATLKYLPNNVLTTQLPPYASTLHHTYAPSPLSRSLYQKYLPRSKETPASWLISDSSQLLPINREKQKSVHLHSPMSSSVRLSISLENHQKLHNSEVVQSPSLSASHFPTTYNEYQPDSEPLSSSHSLKSQHDMTKMIDSSATTSVHQFQPAQQPYDQFTDDDCRLMDSPHPIRLSSHFTKFVPDGVLEDVKQIPNGIDCRRTSKLNDLDRDFTSYERNPNILEYRRHPRAYDLENDLERSRVKRFSKLHLSNDNLSSQYQPSDRNTNMSEKSASKKIQPKSQVQQRPQDQEKRHIQNGDHRESLVSVLPSIDENDDLKPPFIRKRKVIVSKDQRSRIASEWPTTISTSSLKRHRLHSSEEASNNVSPSITEDEYDISPTSAKPKANTRQASHRTSTIHIHINPGFSSFGSSGNTSISKLMRSLSKVKQDVHMLKEKLDKQDIKTEAISSVDRSAVTALSFNATPSTIFDSTSKNHATSPQSPTTYPHSTLASSTPWPSSSLSSSTKELNLQNSLKQSLLNTPVPKTLSFARAPLLSSTKNLSNQELSNHTPYSKITSPASSQSNTKIPEECAIEEDRYVDMLLKHAEMQKEDKEHRRRQEAEKEKQKSELQLNWIKQKEQAGFSLPIVNIISSKTSSLRPVLDSSSIDINANPVMDSKTPQMHAPPPNGGTSATSTEVNNSVVSANSSPPSTTIFSKDALSKDSSQAGIISKPITNVVDVKNDNSASPANSLASTQQGSCGSNTFKLTPFISTSIHGSQSSDKTISPAIETQRTSSSHHSIPPTALSSELSKTSPNFANIGVIPTPSTQLINNSMDGSKITGFRIGGGSTFNSANLSTTSSGSTSFSTQQQPSQGLSAIQEAKTPISVFAKNQSIQFGTGSGVPNTNQSTNTDPASFNSSCLPSPTNEGKGSIFANNFINKNISSLKAQPEVNHPNPSMNTQGGGSSPLPAPTKPTPLSSSTFALPFSKNSNDNATDQKFSLASGPSSGSIFGSNKLGDHPTPSFGMTNTQPSSSSIKATDLSKSTGISFSSHSSSMASPSSSNTIPQPTNANGTSGIFKPFSNSPSTPFANRPIDLSSSIQPSTTSAGLSTNNTTSPFASKLNLSQQQANSLSNTSSFASTSAIGSNSSSGLFGDIASNQQAFLDTKGANNNSGASAIATQSATPKKSAFTSGKPSLRSSIRK